jgi:hypothetical protein
MLERGLSCCLRQWCDAIGAGEQTKTRGQVVAGRFDYAFLRGGATIERAKTTHELPLPPTCKRSVLSHEIN